MAAVNELDDILYPFRNSWQVRAVAHVLLKLHEDLDVSIAKFVSGAIRHELESLSYEERQQAVAHFQKHGIDLKQAPPQVIAFATPNAVDP